MWTTTDDQGYSKWKTGTTGSFYAAQGHIMELVSVTEDESDIAYLGWPDADENGSIIWTHSVWIPKVSDKKEAAKTYIREVIFSQKMQQWSFNNYGKLPVMKDYYGDGITWLQDQMPTILSVADASSPIPLFADLQEYLDILFMLVIGVLTVPYIMYLIPIYLMEYQLGLQNSWIGLILPYVALNLPWGILIMRGAFSTIPTDLRDAAIIDGCSEFQLWYKVLMPINRPSMAATTIITFVFAWQEYMFASTLMTSNEWQTLPVLILFFIFRDFFIEGLSEGMLKG